MDPKAYLEMKSVEQRHWWFVARRKIIESVIAQLNLPATARILEVGCGTGGNLKMLSSYGRVDAIEMNQDAVALVRKEHGDSVRVIQGVLPGISAGMVGQYDLVCMFDVLEHIEDERAVLKDVRSLLNGTGKLIVTVPAYGWLWGAHDEFLHHKRRYTLHQLEQALTGSGLAQTKLSYFNTWLFPLVAFGRLFDKLSKPTSSTGTGVPPVGINWLLKTIFTSEKWLLKIGRIPFGVSLLAISKKDDASAL